MNNPRYNDLMIRTVSKPRTVNLPKDDRRMCPACSHGHIQHRDAVCKDCWQYLPTLLKDTAYKLRNLGIRYTSPEWAEFQQMCIDAVKQTPEARAAIADILADIKTKVNHAQLIMNEEPVLPKKTESGSNGFGTSPIPKVERRQ